MAPTPAAKSNCHTPSSKSNQTQFTNSKTPQSKHRPNFTIPKPSPNPSSTAKDAPPTEHPVEVIGRIRDYPDQKEKPVSFLQIDPDRHSLRIRTEIGYRDFSFDGISLSEEEDLDGFYKKFVASRINDVKLGARCTIMMYGPTGSGKSHTMFGCAKQQGIVYRSLKDILGEENEGRDKSLGVGPFVQVTVLEIYNEELYDLLSTNNSGGGLSLGWSKGSASKVRLEVMGKKAKNATFISGNEAAKISKEIQKVEKRRIVKSTLCNERSSRSHCMIILDVPMVGGQLMLVDMAGSENIEQAGQIGLEAKMQTAKINQGNIALKRVVESIANGDSHVPFRDSKLTMLLQDSFEDDKSKILMILCASPDPKEMHKTISTLEYGAKAKCIVRGPHTPLKDKNGGNEDSSSAVILGSRIAAMDRFIFKLQMENKQREKERNEAHKQLTKKEEEISALRAKLASVGTSEEEINLKVNERTQMLKRELEKKILECEKMATEFVELERRKMEKRILQQQQELELLRYRLEEIELELLNSSDRNGEDNGGIVSLDGSSFAKRLLGIYSNEDPGMEKSMDLDRSMDLVTGKQEIFVQDTKYIEDGSQEVGNNSELTLWDHTKINTLNHDAFAPIFANKVSLSTVFEEGEEAEEQEEDKENLVDEEVQKEVIEEKIVYSSPILNFNSVSFTPAPHSFAMKPDLSIQTVDYFRDKSDEKRAGSEIKGEPENAKDTASSRRTRIQNIFTLCGNYRELSQHNRTPVSAKKRSGSFDPHSSPVRTIGDNSVLKKSLNEICGNVLVCDKTENKILDSGEIAVDSKENYNPLEVSSSDSLEVYVKWEASKEHKGRFITTLKAVKDATLADLRKLIEIHLGAEKQAFTFLVLGDHPNGAPVPREKEATLQASKLPICNQLRGHLACLRPVKVIQSPNHLPFSPLQNILNVTAAR
ncbi:Kinesin-like protein [Actinidia chinensis var. chinensis]|uniref:Kinesin-like protein KIN-10A n=1 Tax=Actinidia chinensis var. chinensis TaxID=1590841 RepID=A0A2R6R8M1_ACTCC|nr:Kinesin-like protein [Actinidia chinensis var. chinensis]